MSVIIRAAVPSRYPGAENTVVALLGWAGGKDQYLVKYSKLYEERGFDTIRFTAGFHGAAGKGTSSSVLKQSRDVSPIMRDVITVLEDPSKSLLFHVLSMNGVFSLCSMQLQYPELNILQRSRGILFDSAPIDFSQSSATSSLKVVDFVYADVLNSGDQLAIAKYRLWKYGQMMRMAVSYAKSLVLGYDTSQSPYHFLRDHPQLPAALSFIYSDKDNICERKTIDLFVESKRNCGGFLVDAHCFADSEHVRHLPKHPKEYNQMIDRYLSNALGQPMAKI